MSKCDFTLSASGVYKRDRMKWRAVTAKRVSMETLLCRQIIPMQSTQPEPQSRRSKRETDFQ